MFNEYAPVPKLPDSFVTLSAVVGVALEVE
jgi:hypothetical protein